MVSFATIALVTLASVSAQRVADTGSPGRPPGASEARSRIPRLGLRGGTGLRDTVLFLADDLGLASLAAVPTPTLDRLRDEGTSYTRMYSMPVCSASRYALLFGEYGRRDGLYRLILSSAAAPPAEPLPSVGLPSLADLFKAAGYQTGLFGKWHVGVTRYGPSGMGDPNLSPLFFGFDTWRAGSWSNLPSGGTGYYDWTRVDDGDARPSTEYADRVLRDEVVSWWERPVERPRFAYVAFRLPHAPTDVPPADLLPAGLPTPTTPRATHEAMIMALDRLMEQMIRWDDDDPDGVIDARTTTLLFSSDNGTPPNLAAPLESPNRVKTSVYEGGVHVPLLVRTPGGVGGVEDPRLLHLVDFFALTAAELRIPTLGGRDSFAFSAGEDRTSLMVEIIDEGVTPTKDQLAMVTARFKLHRRNGIEQIFDLLLDPGETSPLAMGAPATVAIRAALLAEEAALPDRR